MTQPKRFDPLERLDRAVDVFWENGFDGIGMQNLCKAMELFPGSLYGTYGDKRRLFLQAIDRYMATCSAEAIGTLQRNPSGVGAIADYFSDLIEGILSGRRRWGCLLTNSIVELAQKDPAVREKVNEHLQRLELAFANAIDRGKAAGEISGQVGTTTAALLVCIVQGINVLAKTGPSKDRLAALKASALSLLNP